MNYQSKVKLFQIASGQPINLGRELTKDELDFRDSLLREEIKELQYAIVDNNRVEILDALCDIKYVNDGTANMLGEEVELIKDCWFYEDFIIKSKTELFDSLETIETNDVCLINNQVILIAASFGFTIENFQTALDRVHESNMSKFCPDIKTAEKTQEFYKKQGIDTYIEPRDKMTVVYRKEDGKVLKSVNFWPPYLLDLV